MSEMAVGAVTVTSLRDDRGRFKAGSVGNPKGMNKSKRLTVLHRDLMRDYEGAKWITYAGQVLLEQVAKLMLEAERERDADKLARLSGAITRVLKRVDVRPGAPKPPSSFDLYIDGLRRDERRRERRLSRYR